MLDPWSSTARLLRLISDARLFGTQYIDTNGFPIEEKVIRNCLFAENWWCAMLVLIRKFSRNDIFDSVRFVFFDLIPITSWITEVTCQPVDRWCLSAEVSWKPANLQFITVHPKFWVLHVVRKTTYNSEWWSPICAYPFRGQWICARFRSKFGSRQRLGLVLFHARPSLPTAIVLLTINYYYYYYYYYYSYEPPHGLYGLHDQLPVAMWALAAAGPGAATPVTISVSVVSTSIMICISLLLSLFAYHYYYRCCYYYYHY